jgi:hypothetical protein
MKNKLVQLLSYLVPLLILAVGVPWHASTAQYEATGVKVVAIAAIVHLFLRYGLPNLIRTREGKQGRDFGTPTKRASTSLSIWPLFLLACAASLAIGMGCMFLATRQLLELHAAFYIGVVLQQLVFVGMGVVMIRARSSAISTVVGLIALGIVALFFAWSSDIVLLAQHSTAGPTTSPGSNMLYAIPALVVALIGIVGRLMQRRLPRIE